MPTVRTPGAPPATRSGAAWDSAFPFERQGRLLRSRSISGLFSRSLHFGLQPPCLRFAVAVTEHHARLGTRLLARLYRGRHLKRQSSTRFQGATLVKPGVPISGIRLSDWLHREAYDCRPLIAGVERRHLGTWRSSPSSRAFSEGSGSYQALSGSSPITFTSPSSKAHQKSGPFAPPALPGINAPIAPSDSRRDHRLMRC